MITSIESIEADSSKVVSRKMVSGIELTKEQLRGNYFDETYCMWEPGDLLIYVEGDDKEQYDIIPNNVVNEDIAGTPIAICIGDGHWMSLEDELQPWAGTNKSCLYNTFRTSDDLDGKVNTQLMLAEMEEDEENEYAYEQVDGENTKLTGDAQTNCFIYSTEYSTVGTEPGDWYVGSKEEMHHLINKTSVIDINKVLTTIGKPVIDISAGNSNYLTSSECEYNHRYCYTIYPWYGFVAAIDKLVICKVRLLLNGK